MVCASYVMFKDINCHTRNFIGLRRFQGRCLHIMKLRINKDNQHVVCYFFFKRKMHRSILLENYT